jgi:hypothetical protein
MSDSNDADERPAMTHSPAFSRRCGAVMNSPYWHQIMPADGDPEFLKKMQARRQLRQNIESAMIAAANYESIPDELRAVFDAAEKAAS